MIGFRHWCSGRRVNLKSHHYNLLWPETCGDREHDGYNWKSLHPDLTAPTSGTMLLQPMECQQLGILHRSILYPKLEQK